MEMIQQVTLLSGHVSPEAAYLVEDYPYGRSLRCQIRYWIETAEKGAAKGQQRFVSQTTNPKVPGDPWNKPKPRTYADIVVMYLDEIEHVHPFSINHYLLTPEGDARFRLMGLYGQIDAETRSKYDRLVQINQRDRRSWDSFESRVSLLAEHIDQRGEVPVLDGPTWTDADGRAHYLGNDSNVYLTLAQQRPGVNPES